MNKFYSVCFKLRKIKAIFLLCLLSIFSFNSIAQINILGKPGYIKIPSSEWDIRNNFSFNIGYLPKENTINRRNFNYKGIHYNTRVGITHFLEIGLNFIYHLDVKTVGIGDRQMDARILVAKEGKYIPGISLIIAFPFNSNNWASYNAISFTKNVDFGQTKFQFTGGYGLPYFFGIPRGKDWGFYPKSEIQNVYLNGFFGGLSWKPVSWAGIMFDYDTRDLNAGLWIGYKDRIGLQYHLYGLKNSGGNVYLKVPLGFESRELRRYRKSLSKGGI